MSDQHLYQQISKLIESNDVSCLKTNRDYVAQLLGSTNGHANAINMGMTAVATSLTFQDEKVQMLSWLFREFQSFFLSPAVGYRIAEFAWDIGALPALSLCLEHKVCHWMVKESRWIQTSKLSQLMETMKLETYALLMNLVHTTFPIIPPIMSAFTSNTHMKQLKKQADTMETSFFFGFQGEVAKLAQTKKEEEFVLKIYDSLLFLLSYMYTEIVVFDVVTPNWIAWTTMLQFASTLAKEVGENGELKRLANQVVCKMLRKFELMTGRTRELMRSHCAHVMALQNNPDLAMKSQTKVLPLTFEDVHRCTSNFEELLRCLQFLFTMTSSNTDEEIIRHLVYLPLHPQLLKQKTEEPGQIADAATKAKDDDDYDDEIEELGKEVDDDDDDDDEETNKRAEEDTVAKTRDVVSLAYEAERRKESPTTYNYSSLLEQRNQPYISLVGLRVMTLLMDLRKQAILFVNKMTTEEFVLQQTALTVSTVLQEYALVIYGFLLAEYKFDPELVESGVAEDRAVKCNAAFRPFHLLLSIFKQASELFEHRRSPPEKMGFAVMEHEFYFWLAVMEVRGFQDLVFQASLSDWDRFLKLLEVLVEATRQLQAEDAKSGRFFPVLLTRWIHFLHTGLHEKHLPEDRERAVQRLREIYLHHVGVLLTSELSAQEVFRKLVMLTDVLFAPILDFKRDRLITQPLVDTRKGELMTMENMHRRIRVLFLDPAFQTLRKDESEWRHPFFYVPWIQDWIASEAFSYLRVPLLRWMEGDDFLKNWEEWVYCEPAFMSALVAYISRFHTDGAPAQIEEMRRFRTSIVENVLPYVHCYDVVSELIVRLPTASVRSSLRVLLQGMEGKIDVFRVVREVAAKKSFGTDASQLRKLCLFMDWLGPREDREKWRKANFLSSLYMEDSFVLKAMSYYLAEAGIHRCNWASELHRYYDLSVSEQGWFDVHPFVLEDFWSSEMESLEVFCLFLDCLLAIMTNGLTPFPLANIDADDDDKAHEEEDERDPRRSTRVEGKDHPWRFVELPSADFWFQVLLRARQLEIKYNDSVEIRSRLPSLNAHLCHSMKMSGKDADYFLYLHSQCPAEQHLWFRLAMLPSTAEFAKTCFGDVNEADDASIQRVIGHFSQQVVRAAKQAPHPRKSIVQCLKGPLYALLRVFAAYKFEYSFDGVDRAMFAVRLVKALLQRLQPFYDDINDRLQLVRLLFSPIAPTDQRALAYHRQVEELFRQKYGNTSLTGTDFLDWLFSPSRGTFHNMYDFYWFLYEDSSDNNSLWFYVLATRWMMQRALTPQPKKYFSEEHHWRTIAYEPYDRFAELAPYNRNQAPLVCKWLRARHFYLGNTYREEDVYLFYFWARDMARAPCELKEYPRSLLASLEKAKEEEEEGEREETLADNDRRRDELVKYLVRIEEHYQLKSFDDVYSKLECRKYGAGERLVPLQPSKWESQEDELTAEIQKFLEKETDSSKPAAQVLDEAKKAAFAKFKEKHRKTRYQFGWIPRVRTQCNN